MRKIVLNKQPDAGDVVWILAGVLIAIYGLVNHYIGIYGLGDLVTDLMDVRGDVLYLIAFLAMLVEGIYLLGGWFPGSSVVVVLGMYAQHQSITSFVAAIFCIYLGWVLAGVINFLLTRLPVFLAPCPILSEVRETPIWIKWFPAFCANYEFEQFVRGRPFGTVFLHTLRLKSIISLLAAGLLYVIATYIDPSSVENKDSLTALLLVSIICLSKGCLRLGEAPIERGP